ncbi:MAG: hypothetical protein AAF583_02655 [Pseudomonadota bacterium]
MFGKKKDRPKVVLQSETLSEVVPPKRIEIGERLQDTLLPDSRVFEITDIDLSDPYGPKVEFRGEWETLKLFSTTVTIELVNVTIDGSWDSDIVTEQRARWHEKLKAHTDLWSSSWKEPVFMLYERSEDSIERGYSKFVFHNAGFQTDIRADSSFFDHNELYHSGRDWDDRFLGSPDKLFCTPSDADTFMKEELFAFTEFRQAVDAPETGRLQRYKWPEVVQSGGQSSQYSDGPHGFVGNCIGLPQDAFEGIRRAIADFGHAVKVEIVIETELFGLDVQDFPNTEYESSSAMAILPRYAQLTGRIKGINLKWDDDTPPASNPGYYWKNKGA